MKSHNQIKSLIFRFVLFLAVFSAGWLVASWRHQTNENSQHYRPPEDLMDREAPSEPHYVPAAFRQDLLDLVLKNDFAAAGELLDSVYVDDQIAYEGTEVFFAVGGYTIGIPGADREYASTTDWLVPGAAEHVRSKRFFNRAWCFAKRYNVRVLQHRSKSQK